MNGPTNKSSKITKTDGTNPNQRKRRLSEMGKLWTPQEEAFLREHYPTRPNAEIAQTLNRSLRAIDNKALSLGLSKSPYFNAQLGEEVEPHILVLGLLQASEFPISKQDLMDRTNIRPLELSRIVHRLRDDGYDIKEINCDVDTSYGLIREGGFDTEHYYKFLGKIETPVVMTSDWHIGNRQHSRQAFLQLLDCIEEHSVATVMINGDLLQGKGVHKREAMDLLMPDLDYQIDVAEEYLNMIPSCVKHIGITMGNHESKVKGNIRVGWDMCKTVAKRVQNAFYYGQVALVQLDGEWEYMMMHTEGSVGYAVSYKGQRIRDNLIQRPHILHLGHIHQPYNIPRPHVSGGANTITSGSLKRESGWEMQRGWTSIIQWYVLHRWSPTRCLIENFRPRTY